MLNDANKNSSCPVNKKYLSTMESYLLAVYCTGNCILTVAVTPYSSDIPSVGACYILCME